MKKKLILILSIIVIVIIGSILLFYNIGLGAVSSDDTEVDFVIEEGSTYYSVIKKLKNDGLIKNELCFKIVK